MMWCIMVRRVVVRCVMMRRVVVRRIMVGGFAVVHFAAMLFTMRPAVAIIVAVGKMTMLGLITAASVVAASAIVMETTLAPAVGVSPAGPGAHAQEDAVVEVRRPIKALGRAAVRWGFIIAPLADGWFADFDGNLRANRWRQGQARKQCCHTE